MTYKEDTIATYNAHADHLDRLFRRSLAQSQERMNQFLSLLRGKDILDLGSGGGDYSLYFKEQGYDPFCVDLSEEFIRLCRTKGLQGVVADIEAFDLKPRRFDGVWACASLMHLKKEVLPQVFSRLRRHLNARGILAFSVTERTEEDENSSIVPDDKRYFSYFNDAELRLWLAPYFTVIHQERFSRGHTFLHYVCQRK